MKVLPIIATAALMFSGIAAPSKANSVQPRWASAIASRACSYLDQGYSPRKAGELAALSYMEENGDYGVRTLAAATKRDSFQPVLTKALIDTCMDTMIRVGKRTSI